MRCRNGLTGELVGRSRPPADLPIQYQPRRVRRTRLQAALVSKVPPGVIHLNKRLVSLQDLGNDGVQLTFEDGTVVVADLVVGADGIRSASVASRLLLSLHVITNQLLSHRSSAITFSPTTRSNSQVRIHP